MQVAFLHRQQVAFLALLLKRVQRVHPDDVFHGLQQRLVIRALRVVIKNDGRCGAVHPQGLYAAQFGEMRLQVVLFLPEVPNGAAGDPYTSPHSVREAAFQERAFPIVRKNHDLSFLS